MTNKTNLIFPHGGYKKLLSYQTAEIIFDLTVEFCEKHLTSSSNRAHRSYRTYDQMIQAARSGKQNIAEGSMASGTSKKTELKMIGVARSSLEELLVDFQDFLRINRFALWGKEDSRVCDIRKLAYKSDRSHLTYMTYLANPESAANLLVCLIHQANFLLDRQLQSLEKEFLDHGGFTEKLYHERIKARKKQYDK